MLRKFVGGIWIDPGKAGAIKVGERMVGDAHCPFAEFCLGNEWVEVQLDGSFRNPAAALASAERQIRALVEEEQTRHRFGEHVQDLE